MIVKLECIDNKNDSELCYCNFYELQNKDEYI